MLYYRFHDAQRRDALLHTSTAPVIVCLHGLLGSGEDWAECLSFLPSYSNLCIDLHGHGASAQLCCDGFDSALNDIVHTLKHALIAHDAQHAPLIMMGYSLGGRLAMYGAALERFSELNVQGYIIEGGNFGLQTDADKQQRLLHDHYWAERFKNEPIAEVLSDWYQQPVFSSLNDVQRAALVIKRSKNNALAIATMLQSTSLARQPALMMALKPHTQRLHYVCGGKDNKFSALAKRSGLNFSQIDDAGHNVHQEQPQAMAQRIDEVIALFLQI